MSMNDEDVDAISAKARALAPGRGVKLSFDVEGTSIAQTKDRRVTTIA